MHFFRSTSISAFPIRYWNLSTKTENVAEFQKKITCSIHLTSRINLQRLLLQSIEQCFSFHNWAKSDAVFSFLLQAISLTFSIQYYTMVLPLCIAFRGQLIVFYGVENTCLILVFQVDLGFRSMLERIIVFKSVFYLEWSRNIPISKWHMGLYSVETSKPANSSNFQQEISAQHLRKVFLPILPAQLRNTIVQGGETTIYTVIFGPSRFFFSENIGFFSHLNVLVVVGCELFIFYAKSSMKSFFNQEYRFSTSNKCIHIWR